MELFVTRFIELFIIPPGILLLILSAGVLLLKKSPRAGKSLLVFGLISFYLLSTPRISGLLIDRVETYPALKPSSLEHSSARAIVVLAGDWEKNAQEYGGDTVGMQTLIRSRYGAFLQRKTGLPLLVSGGITSDQTNRSLAQMMAVLLKDEFKAGEIWLEDKSRTTAENAFFSKDFLARKKIETVYLVTQASHMRRSVDIFEKAGLKVIPAPTRFEGGEPRDSLFGLASLMPGTRALNKSRIALHEIIGILWYKIRY